MSTRPDDESLSEPEPVSQVRPTTPPSARLQGVSSSSAEPDAPASGPRSIGAIRMRSIPASSARVAAEDEETASVPRLDPSGRYATDDPAPRSGSPERSRRLMRQAFESCDHDTALAEAEGLLAAVPDDAEAKAIASRCRETVEEVLVALLGGEMTVFEVVVDGLLVQTLRHDPQTAVLVVLIESGFKLGEILDMCGERRVAALRVLDRLVRHGAVGRR